MLELPPTETTIVYIDECGRGSLVFDVTAAAVIMPATPSHDIISKLEMIKDSKKLTPKRREMLAEFIKENAVAWAIGSATVDEVDRYNILQANFLAMHRALDVIHAKCRFDKIEVDGNSFRPYIPPGEENKDWVPFECIVDGDAKKIGIAAASIIAKVHRDKQIEELCDQNPELHNRYGLRSNKGYGTKQHLDGLKAHGPSPYHRKTFAPVAAVQGK